MNRDDARPGMVCFQSQRKYRCGVREAGRRLIGLAMLLILAVAAQAQYGDSWGIPWNNPVSATLSTSVWNNWTIYQLQQKKAGKLNSSAPTSRPSSSSSSSPSAAAPPKAAVNEAALRFRPTGTHLLTNKLADQIGHNPAEKQQVTTLLTAIFQTFDQQAVKLGKPNDLALAMSFFLGQNATVFHGTPDAPDAQFLQLRETVALAFGQSGAFRNMTDRQKQELYETLVAYTGLAYAGYIDAKRRGDQANVKEFQKIAGMNLKNITHIEPERIAFTAEGLTITK